MKKILIVEDELDIQELLGAYLRDAGYQTAAAGDGVEALALFGSQPFDLVLLDVMLPKIDGFGVCELIRRQSQVPILMLTALDGEEQQLKGFGLDIDDYVTKPFSIPVLLEKIRVILRRSSGETQESCLCYRDLVLNPDTREVLLDGKASGADRTGICAAANLFVRAGTGVHPRDAAGKAVGVRLLRRRADCGQSHQKSAPQAGPRLHRDGERGGLPCCEGNSLRA